ncbi:hypothetical protein ABT340_39430 [Streptosporangium sp. NPDC000239]|uniref:hypothetical protein n=1 Tax=Streptosporangium sp. NPDC000239 TaxID=3154248 RepID=UPI00332A893A
MINPGLLSSMWERNAQYWHATDPGNVGSPLPVRRPVLPSWTFDEADVALEDKTLERLALLTAECGSSWAAACEAFGPYSFAREFFASQPSKVERLARERRRWQMLRHQWPVMSRVKASYHRRRRNHRG